MKYRKLKKYKYQLMEELIVKIPIYNFNIITNFVKLNSIGYLTLEKWYACDGPSGPTIDTKSFMRGSFVHDALYQLIRLGLLPMDYKPIADWILYDICIEQGMNSFRADYVYQGVKLFGHLALRPDEYKIEIITI